MKSYNPKRKKKAYVLKIRKRYNFSSRMGWKKNLFLNFEPYNLAIYMVNVYKILYTPYHTSYDPTVRSV